MKRLSITLVDISIPMTRAWKQEFSCYPEVSVSPGSIFQIEADAVVSPANSFGNMDGGLDGKLRDYFGQGIERTVRDRIRKEFFGELPVGMAFVVPTNHAHHPFLVCAPTMRYPEDVSSTINAYLAMKALLTASLSHPAISSVAVPGLCALSGRMAPSMVARQMRIAYERVFHRKYDYSHWREERAFVDFILGRVATPPEDLEIPLLRKA